MLCAMRVALERANRQGMAALKWKRLAPTLDDGTSRPPTSSVHWGAAGVRSMPWKSVAVVAILVLGAAPMTTRTAFARGLAGGAHFGAAHFGGSHFAGGGIAGPRPAIGRGFADRRFAIGRRFAAHRFVIRRGFGRAFGGNFSAGGLWPYDPLWTGP